MNTKAVVVVCLVTIACARESSRSQQTTASSPMPSATSQNSIRWVKVLADTSLFQQAGWEAHVTSEKPFPARGLMPTMLVGDVQSQLSTYVEGSTNHLAFFFSDKQLQQMKPGASISVFYSSAEAENWSFGTLDSVPN